MLARIKQKPPPDFSSGGSVTYLHLRYFAQQPRWALQQAPPLQQSADCEVAVTDPTSASDAMIINRYFIGFSWLNFQTLARRDRRRADTIKRTRIAAAGRAGARSAGAG